MQNPENWLDEILPFPRPEYAKQTESLLTDLLWRSEGSSLAHQPDGPLIHKLADLKQASSGTNTSDPDRLIPKRRHGGSLKLFETMKSSVPATGSIYLTIGL